MNHRIIDVSGQIKVQGKIKDQGTDVVGTYMYNLHCWSKDLFIVLQLIFSVRT